VLEPTECDRNARREDSPDVRLLLRAFLGFFGGSFLGTISFVLVWISFDPGLPTETPATIGGLIGFIAGAAAVGYFAFSRYTLLRILAWAIGGAGFGNVLLSMIAGGLSVGTFLTPSGIVLAIVGAVLGFRTVPPRTSSEISLR
jgi:hypothetical protein